MLISYTNLNEDRKILPSNREVSLEKVVWEQWIQKSDNTWYVIWVILRSHISLIHICLCSYKVEVAQPCLTLCNLIDYTVHGILQARILVGILSLLQGNLPNPGTEPRSPAEQADSLPAEPPGKPFSYKWILSINYWKGIELLSVSESREDVAMLCRQKGNSGWKTRD